MAERNYLLTPVGRLVSGHPMVAQDKDQMGKPLTNMKGEPKVNYFIGLAIPKTDPEFGAIWQEMNSVARAGFPQFFGADGKCTHPTFSFKLIDGDGADTTGQPYSNREGYAGHWVLRLSTGFAPQCYTKGGAARIAEPDMIKRGYYMRAYISVEPNGNIQKPGIYLNYSMIELVGYGPEITSGPDGATIFGGAPVANLPVGASAAPVGGAPLAMPTPAAPVAPMPTPAAPTPVVKYVAPNGTPYTMGELTAAGWTAEQVKALPLAPATDFLNPPMP